MQYKQSILLDSVEKPYIYSLGDEALITGLSKNCDINN